MRASDLVLLSAGLLGLTAGCGSGEASVALVFPNTVAMQAVRRIRVEAYPPSTGGAASDRDCGDFRNLARDGMDPVGTPTRGDFPCVDAPDMPCAVDWFNDLELPKVDSGRQIVYVLAYSSTDEDATPILEGCTDRFDSTGGGDESKEVPINLGLVIPKSARLVKTAGDRQVGRAGQEAPVPLQARVEAESPTGSGYTYVIPGVPIRFTSSVDGYELISDGVASTYDTFSGADGRAEVRVRLPNAAGAGRVVVRAAELEAWIDIAERAQGEFRLSVTEPARFASSQVLQGGSGAQGVQVALGYIDAGDDLDLVMLGCRGTEEGCRPGAAAVAPYGQASLTVIKDLGGSAQLLPVTGEQGILPGGLALADIRPAVGIDEIAVVNGRRADCQARVCTAGQPCPCYGVGPGEPCPCEGAEVRIFGVEGSQVVLRSRHTMTASNAVGVAAYASANIEPHVGLAVVAQGRSVNSRPCSQSNHCLPHDPMLSSLCLAEPESCGCPPEERCECQGCSDTQQPGVCVARDKVVDLLEFTRARSELTNRGGCQMPVIDCDINNTAASTCECLDADLTGNTCTEREGCNCKAPERIHVGDDDAPVLPYSIVAGAVDSGRDWDLMVPSIGGLELIKNLPGGETFEWRGEPIVNAPMHGAAIANMDSESERDGGGARVGDVVWYAQAPCQGGPNFNASCPIWRAPEPGASPKGCLGVYYSDGAESLFDLRTPSIGGCRRHFLDEVPAGMCVGRFNGDDFEDIVVTSRQSSEVLVFSGDGRGGLLDPPERFSLPAGGVGGPAACGDVNRDGTDDLVVVDGFTGAIYVLESGS